MLAVPHPMIDLSPAKLADFDYVMRSIFYSGFQYGNECVQINAEFSERGSVR